MYRSVARAVAVACRQVHASSKIKSPQRCLETFCADNNPPLLTRSPHGRFKVRGQFFCLDCVTSAGAHRVCGRKSFVLEATHEHAVMSRSAVVALLLVNFRRLIALRSIRSKSCLTKCTLLDNRVARIVEDDGTDLRSAVRIVYWQMCKNLRDRIIFQLKYYS